MKQAKVSAVLFFTASLLAFAAYVVSYARGHGANLSLLAAGAAMGAFGVYARSRIAAK
jgi:hypothetical protein